MTTQIAPRLRVAALGPFALILFILPVLMTSAFLLHNLVTGAEGAMTSAEDAARYQRYPHALGLHAIGGIAMLALGIVQVTPALRRRFPAWHRWAGRAIVVAGLAFAVTGLVMNATVSLGPVAYDVAQNVAAVLLIISLALGVQAIRQRAVAQHRAWMLRAYAVSLGAATQTMVLLPVYLLIGPPNGLLSLAVMVGAWPLNLAIAEWIIRRG